MEISECKTHTQPKKAGEDDGTEQEEEADGELSLLGDGGNERVTGGGVPDGVKRLGRHESEIGRIWKSE